MTHAAESAGGPHLAAHNQVVIDIADAGNGGTVGARVNINAEEHHAYKYYAAVQVAAREHRLHISTLADLNSFDTMSVCQR